MYSVLSVPNPWTYFINDKKEEVEVAKECNNELASIMEKFPETFRAFATLPLSDVESSIEEAERAVKELGLLGFVIGTGIKGKTIADKEFHELVKFLEKLGKPIFIHPGTLLVTLKTLSPS
ncbi:amidohydrolase family protein [Acidianus infernus]|uniref:amidohydrolase family protein n=1 Tax=Acidianus infernus TaxID=12915 RepID=UPI0035932D22